MSKRDWQKSLVTGTCHPRRRGGWTTTR